MPMTHAEAETLLSDAEVIACMQAPVNDAKEILSACLEADIPALLNRAECCGKNGCACTPKLEVLVRPDDVAQFAALVDSRWKGLVDREGLMKEAASVAEGEDPPCPACGTAGPLEAGACKECGLQLE